MEDLFDESSEPRKIIEVTTPKSSRPLWQKLAFLVILIALAALAVFGLTRLIGNSSEKAESDKTTDKAAKEEATTSAKASSERCSPKQDLDNPKQGYQACFEAGWKMKEIKVSGLEIGLASSEIAGNFPGTINISITDQSEDLFTQNQSNSSSKFEFGKVNVDGKKSTQLVITRSRDDSLIAYPRAIITATNMNGRTYVFTLNSTDTTFEADTKLYEDFLGTVDFLDAEDPPWSESRNIVVHQPWVGDRVSSPATISGEALSFEATVNVRIKDKSGKTLTETTIKSASGTARSEFSGSVNFDKGKATEGTIEVYNSSAADGSDQDKVVIPVKF